MAADTAAQVTAYATVAGAAFLALAAAVAFVELRRAARARETEILLNIAWRWLDPTISESIAANLREEPDALRGLLVKPHEELTDDERDKWRLLLPGVNFLEAIGYLEEDRDAIKLRDIEAFWGNSILQLWNRWEPAVVILRQQPKQGEGALATLERLAKRVRRQRERRIARSGLTEMLRGVRGWDR
jgi:hypothetical protein